MIPSTPPATVRVAALYCYPIKSCRGTPLAEATVARRGIDGDRGMMVVDADGRFLTQREHPRLALIEPRLRAGGVTVTAPGMPALTVADADEGPRVRVVVWRDTCRAVDQGEEAAAWFSDYLGVPCRLVRMADDFVRRVDGRYARRPDDQAGFADGYPFLLLSDASLADLNDRLPAPLEMRRFRPNIVVTGCAPYAEDDWRRIRIGPIAFDVVKPCARCVITTTDQETTERGAEPLATLATYRHRGRGVMFGQNLVHEGAGPIRVGDAVAIVDG